MRISTEIASGARTVGEVRAIELIAKAGFDGWDFSMFCMGHDRDHALSTDGYLAFARELRKIGLDNGIVCNQAHAPFPVFDPKIRSCLKRAIECTAEAGGHICVIHPDNYKSAKENAEMYSELLPFAKDCGVKIGVENMWNWLPDAEYSSFAACATGEDFLAHLNAVNDGNLVACLDIGHAEMKGSGDGAVNMIHRLGHHLQALHLHDNDLRGDSHQIPFSMSIDFPAVVRALKEIGYKGWFTLEANQYLHGYEEDAIPGGYVDLANSARKLADLFEK